jgi:hypothetical protein
MTYEMMGKFNKNILQRSKKMRKAIFISFIVGIFVVFGSSAMAALDAPLWSEDPVVQDGYVCFNWEDVEGAVKYSVDVEVPVDTDGDYEPDLIVELSFGTSDRTDGGLMGESDLCVPLSEFIYDDDNDPATPDVQLTGNASAKVKALAPGKGKGRQNNTFSIWKDFVLPLP